MSWIKWLNVPDHIFYEYIKGIIDSACKYELFEYRRWRIWLLKKKNTLN